MPKLYFCIGRPRSGKSTFCNRWVEQEAKRVVVSSDDIRMALHGQRYEPLYETMVFAIKHVVIRAHLHRGMDVIVDGTHSSEVSIQRILEIDNCAIPILFETSEHECIKRAIEIQQFDLVNPIKRIGRQIDLLIAEGIENVIERILRKIHERGLYEGNISY